MNAGAGVEAGDGVSVRDNGSGSEAGGGERGVRAGDAGSMV